MKNIINTDNAPAPVGPYNQAIRTNNLIFTSGQIAIDPNSGHFIDGDIKVQTRQVIENLNVVLNAAGSSLSDVIKATVYLDDMSNFSDFNAIYSEFFTDNYPVRTTVQVSSMAMGAKVEIDLIALVKNQ